MTEKKLHLTAAKLRPLVPIAAVVLAAIAAWMAWTGWQQMRDAQRDAALRQVRDVVAQGTSRALAQQKKQMADRLALPAVQSALANGDLAAAAAAVRSGWPRLERVDIVPAELDDAYAGLPKSGFGSRAEEHTSALESQFRKSYPVFSSKKKRAQPFGRRKSRIHGMRKDGGCLP